MSDTNKGSLSKEEYANSYLRRCVQDSKILIDACSLLSEFADLFWAHIIPILEQEGKSMIVPWQVYKEVKNFADNPIACLQKNDLGLNKRAKKAANTIAIRQKAGLVQVFGDKDDNFADNVFLTVVTQKRLNYNLLIITQDRRLAQDIMMMSKTQSVITQYLTQVRRINSFGYLSPFSENSPYQGMNRLENINGMHSSRFPLMPKAHRNLANERFNLATSVTSVTGPLKVSYIPKSGDCVFAERDGQRRSFTLGAAGPSGGEGTIYDTDRADLVAKIYKPERLTRARYEKLRLMLSKKINCPGVCFPTELVMNNRGEFVGYLMKRAPKNAKELRFCIFIPQLLKTHFPNWKKTETVELCVTILEKLKYLHDRNIILGDINPGNILVVSSKEVYFVDTDSYQIEGFPCPVGTVTFTPPEIQRKDFSKFLRTIGNENFAVATLLFMIMLPGKSPYAMQGGENMVENILNGDFSYNSGASRNNKVPAGPWRFCWSHLPRFLKDAFYATFRKEGEHHAEGTRFNTEKWLGMFKYYLKLLQNGSYASQDAMSMELFPTRFKNVMLRCSICGQETPSGEMRENICKNCLQQGEICKCSECGREFVYTNYMKFVKKLPRPRRCMDCENQNEYRECIDCGCTFSISLKERNSFIARGHCLPKRCKQCRDAKHTRT